MKHIDFTVPLPQGYDPGASGPAGPATWPHGSGLRPWAAGAPLRRPNHRQVRARFPGHDADDIRRQRRRASVSRTRLDGDGLRFQLSPHIAFEELDYVWGCLFELLY